MNLPHAAPIRLAAPLALTLALSAAASVPRETFGRAPQPPASVILLRPAEETPAPLATLAAVSAGERTLPLSPATARVLRFESRLTPTAPARALPAGLRAAAPEHESEAPTFLFVPAVEPNQERNPSAPAPVPARGRG